MSKGMIKKENIFLSGDKGYIAFRIPTLIKSTDGTIIAFCEGRKDSRYWDYDHGDIDIVSKKSYDNGKTWQNMEVIISNSGYSHNNPCPFTDRVTKKVWLIYMCSNGKISVPEMLRGEGGRRKVYSTFSTDNGKNWSNPKEITSQVMKKSWSEIGIGPCHAIQLKNESIAVPIYFNIYKKEIKKSSPTRPGVIISEDHGESWKIGGSIGESVESKEFLFDECSIVELANDDLILNIRNTNDWFFNPDHNEKWLTYYEGSIDFDLEKVDISKIKNNRLIARSSDKGNTWEDIWYDEQLADPCCQGSILRYTLESQYDKNRILFSNCDSPLERKNMSIKMSYDECKSWQFNKVLHSGPCGYSDIAITRDNNIIVVYECGEESDCERIDAAIFDLDWLTDGDDSM